MNAFSLKSRLCTHFSVPSVGAGSHLNSLINIFEKSSDKSVLTIALLKPLFKMQIVIMLSMAVAVCLGKYNMNIIVNMSPIINIKTPPPLRLF